MISPDERWSDFVEAFALFLSGITLHLVKDNSTEQERTS
jgi:hypothetical protein